MHRHDTDQLLYAVSGTMSVTTGEGTWVIPPQRGIWVAADVRHRLAMSGLVRMRTLYFPPGSAFRGSPNCRVLGISPLDRELILELVRTPESERDRKWLALACVLLERLSTLPVVPLHLPFPRDGRAKRAADAVIDDPAGNHTMAVLAQRIGASERTLARVFARETGMTFGQWQRQARLLAALPLLAEGRPVKNVALDVGYSSASAFIAMFRRVLGVSPGHYFDAA